MERQLDKKLKTSSTFSGSFPSPESPEDIRAVGYPKGWYSERVPHSSNHARKGYNATSAAIMPFSSGRALPSKWDDAERWISSPISVGNVYNHGNYVYEPGVYRNAQLARNYQRRVKSKSGPLGNGPPGLSSYESYNNNTLFPPVLGVGVVNGGKWRHSLAIESRVGPEELDDGEVGRRRSYTGGHDLDWSDLWSGPISSSDKRDVNLANDGFESIKYDENYVNNDNDDENHVRYNEEGWKNEARVDRVISRRDMATQMYVESESSSQCGNSPRPLLGNNEPNLKTQSQEYEIKDVQIDRQTSRATQRSSSISKGREASSDCAIVGENTKTFNDFRLRREEARINAWESLQKIKAESAIQKLEMKLENKRETMTKKIMEKLRKAKIKAQKMRISLGNDNTTHLKSSSTIHSFRRKICWSSTCYSL